MFLWEATLKPLYTFVANVLAAAFEVLGDAIKVITDIFDALFGDIAPGIDIFELLHAGLDAICNIIKTIVKVAFTPFKIALAVIKTVVLMVIQKFKDFLAIIKPVTDFLAEKLKPILDAISATFGAISNTVGGFIDVLGGAWDALTNWSDEVIHGKEAVDELGNSVARLTEDEITAFAAELASTVREIDSLDSSIETVVREIGNLEQANADLVAQIADVTRIDEITSSLDYYKRSSKDASYATKIFDRELRTAQTELLKTMGLLDGMNETLDEYGDTQKRNNLAVMKIRYRAKKEGRELTEEEEKQIAKIELANEELRIKVEEEQIRMDDIEETALSEQKERVDDRIRSLEKEKEAIEDKAQTEVEKLQKEIDANNNSILEKTLSLNQFAVDRRAAIDRLNDELMIKQDTFNADEIAKIETQSSLKLDEIDGFIIASEEKWKIHYGKLTAMANGEIPGDDTGEDDDDTGNKIPPPKEEPKEEPKTHKVIKSTVYVKYTGRDPDTGELVGVYNSLIRSSSGKEKKFNSYAWHNPDERTSAKNAAQAWSTENYPKWKEIGWEKGGYISQLSRGVLHPGEYVLPKKVVNLLDTLVASPASAGAAYNSRSEKETHTIERDSGTNINIYGTINLPNVQDVDSFMRELHRRARIAGARV